ncbi:hypothetical protein MRX96_042503 [Rhipicephalus microplus]
MAASNDSQKAESSADDAQVCKLPCNASVVCYAVYFSIPVAGQAGAGASPPRQRRGAAATPATGRWPGVATYQWLWPGATVETAPPLSASPSDGMRCVRQFCIREIVRIVGDVFLPLWVALTRRLRWLRARIDDCRGPYLWICGHG